MKLTFAAWGHSWLDEVDLLEGRQRSSLWAETFPSTHSDSQCLSLNQVFNSLEGSDEQVNGPEALVVARAESSVPQSTDTHQTFKCHSQWVRLNTAS